MKLKNKMIIVCGGRGSRMGKITSTIPKPLIKIGKEPLIQHKIKYYNSEGIQNFIFCLGYKADQLKKYLKYKVSSKSIYDNAGLSAGILKRIFSVKKYVKEATIISYGDTLAKINLKDLLQNHKKSNCSLTIVVAPIQNPFGLVKWNLTNKATAFEEKPILNHFIGYAVISPKFFKKINNRLVNLKDGNGIIQAIKYLIKKKQVNIYKFNNLQVTINSPDELKNARSNYKKYFTL
tara:strand:+ start:839 stop:1543 length:705 start_codon:yes stop_codon:yes gene_type:complete